jgi:glutamine amidotransferase
MIQVVDLGINNLSSLVRALEEVSEERVTVVKDGGDVSPGRLLILPGTGNFGEATSRIESRGFDDALLDWSRRGDGLLVGVCLGMQLLFESSHENAGSLGLSLIPGDVAGLGSIGGAEARVPHVGWSEVSRAVPGTFEWLEVEDGTDFYFSHSFAVEPVKDDHNEYLVTSFGTGNFASAIRRGPMVGFQFHPEKSSFAGRNLLSSVVKESRAIA